MKLNAGRSPLHPQTEVVCGRQVALDGEDYYRIDNFDRMRPFFMSIVSNSDHWMFISSTGALTAGRRTADLALFPYYTDDKIHDSAEVTGSKTVLLVKRKGADYLWEPFSDRCGGIYRLQRNLCKNFCGNKLLFEESNADLGLSFRYGWSNSERFGWVRHAWLVNLGPTTARIKLLDGVQNLMPCGTGSRFQLEYSTLLDAYKRNELVEETGLGLFRLSAIPVDRPEPAESLRTTTVWSLGLGRNLKLLSSIQIDSFRQGHPVRQETDVRAERGAYFVCTTFALPGWGTKEWWTVADVGQGPSDVAGLNRLLRQPLRLRKAVADDIARGTDELGRIVGSADGLQRTAQPLGNARHFNNVLFNVMRGGIFSDGYRLNSADLQAFVRQANKTVAARHVAFFRKLGSSTDYTRVVTLAAQSLDPQLERLCREYLPLTFSRRHGDPSRPWNRFSIATRKPDGTPILNYEGNWRDIFQNWEALALSFPGYTAGMICKFVNASTADGYNPYRITRDGVDWEVIDPHDPWSHIGYWGDHQIIYLLKLLEILDRHEPATLRGFLTRDIFACANVPYRIKPYDRLLENPKDTVLFDQPLQELVQRRVQTIGSDGKLLWDRRGRVRLVNLTEKLLAALLAKLSNFIPEAGIWLNTQRPEWNDANNALVGNGVSMVTLYHLRRHLAFCLSIFQPLANTGINLSEEVGRFFIALHRVLTQNRQLLSGRISDQDRKRVLDKLGRAGSQYRQRIYDHGFCGRTTRIQVPQLCAFFSQAQEWVNHSIRANHRSDGLYEAYNLINLNQKSKIPIRRLYEMLEGQAAVLASGHLSAGESLRLLQSLKQSAMYRADQHSYLLYPNRQLARFVEKNNIPPREFARSALLRRLVTAGDRTLVERDVSGRYHFNGSITNAGDVSQVMKRLADSGYARLVRKDRALILEIFDRLFDHQSFTGRSGTFFGYEGLGCIYWHMVSKLLLAAQETFFRAASSGTPPMVLRKLARCYWDIRAGIGDHKSPQVYGAFPMDPYSHTPGHAGARQPGLTGQVKEDILCRWGELGVYVEDGQIHLYPRLLQLSEFLTAPADFRYHTVTGLQRRLRLKAGSLAFTYCQVPVVYQLARHNSLSVSFADGAKVQSEALCLDKATSRSVFERAGLVARVDVWFTKTPLARRN